MRCPYGANPASARDPESVNGRKKNSFHPHNHIENSRDSLPHIANRKLRLAVVKGSHWCPDQFCLKSRALPSLPACQAAAPREERGKAAMFEGEELLPKSEDDAVECKRQLRRRERAARTGRSQVGEAKALRDTAGEATAPVTALPEWPAPARAPREPARSVSLEPCCPPTPGVVSLRGTGEAADPQDAVARLRGTGIAPRSRTCEAPGAASVAGGAQPQRERPRGCLRSTYRQLTGRSEWRAERRASPGDRQGEVQVPTPTTTPARPRPTHQEPDAASPLTPRDCGGVPVNNTPPPPASRNFEGETPHFRKRGARRGLYQMHPFLSPIACLLWCWEQSSHHHVVPTARIRDVTCGRSGTGQPGGRLEFSYLLTRGGIVSVTEWRLLSGGLWLSKWLEGGALCGPYHVGGGK